VTEQPHAPPRDLDATAPDTAEPGLGEPLAPRRLPGEPHPYMLQRNPPNLWILVWMTVFSLVVAALVMALTVLL
jgi:hypothetical protein